MRALLATFALLLAAGAASAMSLSSKDFSDGGKIPLAQIYSRCGGENVSPELSWKGVPGSARTLMITMIDHDVAPDMWSHWIVIGIPPQTTGLARGAALPAGAHALVNNFGQAGYDGPCPPMGTGTHHYRITLWALPMADPRILGNAPAKELETTLPQLAIDHASITGTVSR